MTAIIFLTAKGIIKNDSKKWLVKYKGMETYDIISLMEEYANCKIEELHHKEGKKYDKK